MKSKLLHKGCLRCSMCDSVLTLQSYKTWEGSIYCASHVADAEKAKPKRDFMYLNLRDVQKAADEIADSSTKSGSAGKTPITLPVEGTVAASSPQSGASVSTSTVAGGASPQSSDSSNFGSMPSPDSGKAESANATYGSISDTQGGSRAPGAPNLDNYGSLALLLAGDGVVPTHPDVPVEVDNEHPENLPPLEEIHTHPPEAFDPSYQPKAEDIIPPLRFHNAIGWCGFISRAEAEAKLQNTPRGTFLTRWSDNAQSYVLTYTTRYTIENIAFIKLLRNGHLNVQHDDQSELHFDSLYTYVFAQQKRRLIAQPIKV